jgi:hypothetical protein
MFQFDGFVIKLCKSRIFFSYFFYLAIEQITVRWSTINSGTVFNDTIAFHANLR